MALVESTMLPLGTILPEFDLVDVKSDAPFSTAQLQGSPALLAVICNHCPYVVRIKDELAELGRELQGQGVTMVAISSNDARRYPADSPEMMRRDAEQFGYPFPYLHDESQDLARALQAVCTPEFYLFDRTGALTYRGRMDASTPGNGKEMDGAELRHAVQVLLAGRPPIEPQHPSMGCSIKWRES